MTVHGDVKYDFKKIENKYQVLVNGKKMLFEMQ